MRIINLQTALLIVLLVVIQTVNLRLAVAQAAEKVIDLRIEQRKIVQPQQTVRVVKGDAVTLRWQTDQKVALHLHGYDLKLDIEPGSLVEMRFDAAVTGRFPITSHGFGGEYGPGHETLLYVEVYPE